MDIKQIKRIMKEFENSSVHKLEISENDFTIRLEKKPQEKVYVESPQPQTHSLPQATPSSTGSDVAEEEDMGVKVASPIVGTYYSKPSPTSTPYVKEGDRVTKGQILFIVEAMKVMNEIVAPQDGVVSHIYKQDSELVEFEETVLVIQ